MPKMKTHRGAYKRFKRTASGKLKRNRAFGSHLLQKKTSKRKRRIHQSDTVSAEDLKRVRRLVPYVW